MSALAIVLFNRGDMEQAIARWKEALNLAVEVGDRRMLAIVNNNLGEALRDQGKLEDAMERFKSCQTIAETLDDRFLYAEVSRNIGILSQKMGDLDNAKNQLEHALKLALDLNSKELEGLTLRALGEVAASTMWRGAMILTPRATSSGDTTACMPLSWLNDEGYVALCESDFVVVPTGILLHYISGKPVFMHNSTFPHKAIVTCAHCTAPQRMDGKRYEPARIPDVTPGRAPVAFTLVRR